MLPRLDSLPRFAALLLAGAATALATEEWAFVGYAKEDGVEWFSLRNRDGTAEWATAGRAGRVMVRSFDPASLTLEIVTGGRKERLRLTDGGIGAAPSVTSAAFPAVVPRLPAMPPLPSGGDAGRDRFRDAVERIHVGHMAARLEEREAAEARARPGAARTPQARRGLSSTADASPGSGADASAGVARAGDPDWAAIYRAVAERRAAYDARLAEERRRREQAR